MMIEIPTSMPVFTTAATAALMHQSDELPTVITATAEKKKKKKKRSSSCLRMVSPATTIATCTSGCDRGQLVVPEDWGLAARDKMMMDDAAAVHPPKRSRRDDDNNNNNNSFANNINNDHNNKDHQHKDHQHSSKKQQKKKKQQHVTFASNVILNESPSIDSPLNRLETNDQWESLWYNAQEMATMKQQIHFLTRQLQAYLTQYQQQNNNNNNSSTNHQNNNHHHLLYDSPKSPSLAVSDDTRGLEQRSCYERQRRKYLTHRYILHIAKTRCNNNNNMDATAMAKRANICSQWATQLAYIEAQRDYIRAYYECE